MQVSSTNFYYASCAVLDGWLWFLGFPCWAACCARGYKQNLLSPGDQGTPGYRAPGPQRLPPPVPVTPAACPLSLLPLRPFAPSGCLTMPRVLHCTEDGRLLQASRLHIRLRNSRLLLQICLPKSLIGQNSWPVLCFLSGCLPSASRPAIELPLPCNTPLQVPIPELCQLRQGPPLRQLNVRVPSEATVPLKAPPGAPALDIEITIDRWARLKSVWSWLGVTGTAACSWHGDVGAHNMTTVLPAFSTTVVSGDLLPAPHPIVGGNNRPAVADCAASA
jgi:hypothetical protein